MVSLDSVMPAEPYRYRNRMDLVRAFGKLGLRQTGNYRQDVDIHACDTMQEGM
jgi:hypothetical protein